jgi:5-methylcytosine-specific restriction protein A
MPQKIRNYQNPIQVQQRKQREAARAKAMKQIYDSDWRKLRMKQLIKNPFCLHCEATGILTEAKQVDHIEPVVIAPHRRLDPTNLQSLCVSCHSIKTAKENQSRK